MSKREDLEDRAIKVIIDKGEEGILQCDLWRMLDANSREGSRTSLRLEAKNLIKRERELFDGRWTYRIFVKRRPLEIDSLLDTPCMSCSDIYRCDTSGEISPITCAALTQWLSPRSE